jgi:FlaA1/EpsC-like NDP-sugar epimerase
MTRFWISIDEAVDLVEHALDLESGMMVIPKARACSIEEVACAITNDHTKHRYIGIRPGEKRYESLVHSQESVRIEDSGKYFYLHPVGKEMNTESFSYVSRAPHSFISAEELRELLTDAETV